MAFLDEQQQQVISLNRLVEIVAAWKWYGCSVRWRCCGKS